MLLVALERVPISQMSSEFTILELSVSPLWLKLSENGLSALPDPLESVSSLFNFGCNGGFFARAYYSIEKCLINEFISSSGESFGITDNFLLSIHLSTLS